MQTAVEQEEYERSSVRLHAQEDLLGAALWTLIHDADEKERKSVEKTLNLLGEFADGKPGAKLVEAGGVNAFKTSAADLLKSTDPVVRGFAAVLLGVIGDHAYTSAIARLLDDKPGRPPNDVLDKYFYNFDRGAAAMALGLIGAGEYAPRLSGLLGSADTNDRAGAALGLGYMGAREYSDDLARLLADDNSQVQTAALQALARLDAAKYARDIAALLLARGDPSVSETACAALVRLNATAQARDLAALLNDEFRARSAAKALALLGAREYSQDIARLMEDRNPLVRCDALIAIGILGAPESVKGVAAHLQDDEKYVRAYAAVALLLLRDQTNATAVVNVVRSEGLVPETGSAGLETTAYFREHIKLHPLLAERERELTARAMDGWERLNRSEK